VPIVQEAGRAPGPVWTVAENLAATGIRSPDRPAVRYTDYATRPTKQDFKKAHNSVGKEVLYGILLDLFFYRETFGEIPNCYIGTGPYVKCLQLVAIFRQH